MKVILAAYSKTGTKSMAAALRELGLVVYDYMDHFWYHDKEWKRIFEKGATDEDFRQMYDAVDAITAVPIFHLWEGIHHAFPDAKIVLTPRDEESWYKSWSKQGDELARNKLYQLVQILTSTGWRYFKFYQGWMRMVYGLSVKNPFDFSSFKNPTLNKVTFRHNQAYCLQNAPKDKLLVYDVKLGWEPLCTLLGKSIPDKSFPHVNAKGKIMTDLMKLIQRSIKCIKKLELPSAFCFALERFFCIGFVNISNLHNFCFKS
ncbi:uncharacterized protein LOC143446542 [Clavelina lepadiformis]|uniref:uncharacterized protein LOC143446542 n=1 Tax=Clavelina lepadiformis TaxID=159417 RepID=UPI00404351AA